MTGDHCDCPLVASWRTDGFQGGNVVYRGQLVTRCRAFCDWVCTHAHMSRYDAMDCADQKLAGLDKSTAHNYTGSRMTKEPKRT